ncbi:MAG: hypothetical protein ABI432_02065 [Flavobacteriales bacterium]
MKVFVLTSVLFVSSALAQDHRAALIADLGKLKSATSDAQRDSVSAGIKSHLRALLEASDAFAASFDDVPMSRVDAPDGVFRLFTWNVPRTDGTNRFEGFLLTRTGSKIAVYELRDMTASIPSAEVPELGPDRWYGALYYQVIPVQKGGRTYYTLLGWKGYSNVETRKVIEVLSFKSGKPRFGAALFGKGKIKSMRKVYGYSFQATMTLRYDPVMEGILLDHLSPSRADMVDQPAYYGPDMTHDAYFWYKNEWWFEPDIDARDPKRSYRPFNSPHREPQP